MSDSSDSDLSDDKGNIIEAKENIELSGPASEGRVSKNSNKTISTSCMNLISTSTSTAINNCTTNSIENPTGASVPFGNIEEKLITPGRAKLHSWLYRTFRILLTDGRILSGAFLCTDADANIILGMCFEDTQKGDEQRMLGLVMVPGRHIVKMEIDMSEPNNSGASPLAAAAKDGPTTIATNSSSDDFLIKPSGENENNVEIALTENNEEITSSPS